MFVIVLFQDSYEVSYKEKDAAGDGTVVDCGAMMTCMITVGAATDTAGKSYTLLVKAIMGRFKSVAAQQSHYTRKLVCV